MYRYGVPVASGRRNRDCDVPQELVQMIVKKAYNMAEMMRMPVLGLVENFEP